jgi:AcrR family transcriptional regulator
MGELGRAVKARRRLPRAEREQQMLDAAEEVFGASGFRAASMEDIAERSGITKPLLYQYFDSKERLYEACVERSRARLFDEIEEAALAAPAAEATRIFAERFFAFIDEHRTAWWLLYGEASSAVANAMRARNAEVIERFLRRALDALGRGADDEALAFLAHALVGAGEQAGRWWREHPEVPKGQAVERFTAMAAAMTADMFRSAQPVAR